MTTWFAASNAEEVMVVGLVKPSTPPGVPLKFMFRFPDVVIGEFVMVRKVEPGEVKPTEVTDPPPEFVQCGTPVTSTVRACPIDPIASLLRLFAAVEYRMSPFA
jgi:hypothetical protein